MLVISTVGPIVQPHEVAWSTCIVLMVAHVFVYITVVKAIQRELASGVSPITHITALLLLQTFVRSA